tara:strand:+ start:6056 stop:6310 length:255 start_codon:yes stop_codon:yes gene_type:complete
MTKLFLLIFLWHQDDTITHNIAIVEECPPSEVIISQFQPMQDMGMIKSWAGYCKDIKFDPPKNAEQEEQKEPDTKTQGAEEINA